LFKLFYTPGVSKAKQSRMRQCKQFVFNKVNNLLYVVPQHYTAHLYQKSL